MDRSFRPSANLSASVHQRLNGYALAAGAAGVGVLALVHPQASHAKIVYTPANETILGKVALNLDLNHDRIVDFYFYLSSTIFRGAHPPSPFGSASLRVVPQQSSNQILGAGTFRQHATASALPAGARIGPKRKFSAGKHLMATTNYGCSSTCGGGSGGPWKEARHRYVGLKFVINGKIHYGWARLTVDADWGKRIQARLTGYAYETIPNKPIIAGKTKGQEKIDEGPDATLTIPTPEPGSLAVLAMGAPGLAVWRREESVGAMQ